MNVSFSINVIWTRSLEPDQMKVESSSVITHVYLIYKFAYYFLNWPTDDIASSDALIKLFLEMSGTNPPVINHSPLSNRRRENK